MFAIIVVVAGALMAFGTILCFRRSIDVVERRDGLRGQLEAVGWV